MTTIVSKQSLGALANLAFTDIRLRAEGRHGPKPERNLESGGATEALYALLNDHETPDTERESRLGAFDCGVEFGLAVAAAILTHGHDSTAVRRQSKPS